MEKSKEIFFVFQLSVFNVLCFYYQVATNLLDMKTVTVYSRKIACLLIYFSHTFLFAVFKGNIVGPWKQYRSTMSNLNFFASMMSSEKMILKTSGPECSYPGDYLRFYSHVHCQVPCTKNVIYVVGTRWYGMSQEY